MNVGSARVARMWRIDRRGLGHQVENVDLGPHRGHGVHGVRLVAGADADRAGVEPDDAVHAGAELDRGVRHFAHRSDRDSRGRDADRCGQ